MSTKVKEALFELIKSLSKSEKRYFKLLSSRHTIGDENNYVRLFDFIDKLSVYDEELIFKEFKGEALLHKFSITKKRLYDHILNALDAYHSSNSVDAQLFKMLHSADILYKKSLYDQCARILKSAEKLAEKNNRHTIQAEINRKQKRLIENSAYFNFKLSDFEDVYQKDELLLDKMAVYNKLWKVKSDLFFQLSRKGKARNEEECSLFHEIIRSLPTAIQVKELPFDSAYLYHHIYSAYYFSIGDLNSSYAQLKMNLALFEDNPANIEANLNSYFSLLTNAIHVSERNGEIAESKRIVKTLKEIPARFDLSQNDDMRIKLFASTYSIELSMLTNNGEYESAETLIPLIESGLMNFGDKISPVRKAFMVFKIASVYLGLGKYSLALKWINQILNDNDLDESEDILSFSHLVDLLIHLEMKHDQLLPYALKNTQRFLKSRNRLYAFEKVFLTFVSKRIKCTNAIDAEILWEDLSNDLKTVHDDHFESIALEYFNFQAWAEAKYHKISFTQLLKKDRLKSRALDLSSEQSIQGINQAS